jgi:putative transposase
VHGELLVLGVKVAASTVGGSFRMPESIRPRTRRLARGPPSCASCVSRPRRLLACDFLETVALTGARM